MKTRITATLTLVTLATLTTAGRAIAQVYQRADNIPIGPAGLNPRTNLEAVAGTPDGGYIAVGNEGPSYLHLARYNSAGNVIWSRFSPTNFNFAQATSINQLTAGANPTYVVAGEVADAYPWGAWVAVIDNAGNLVCPIREFNGVGPSAIGNRSPVAVKPLNDQSYVVTGRSQAASTAPIFGRLTRFAPGCGAVMWSRVYSASGGVNGLSGACEITDVVEEPNPETLLAVGSAALSAGGSVPFLLRVDRNNGNVITAAFYGNGDPALNLRGDGLAASLDVNGVVNGYVFSGRSTPVNSGAAATTSAYVVRVDLGLNIIWGENFRDVEPCHAGVRTFRNSTLLVGTRNTPNQDAANVWGALVNSGNGAPIWNWNYGRQQTERGNGVSITTSTATSPLGPIIVGTRPLTATGAGGGGFLVKSDITAGSSGGCEAPANPPFTGAIRLPAQFAATFVQNLRVMENQLLGEQLSTFDACPPICCSSDFDNDGDFGTDADIEAFFACLAGVCCPTCGTSDFNCDGDYGTDMDIEAFFSVLAGGSC